MSTWVDTTIYMICFRYAFYNQNEYHFKSIRQGDICSKILYWSENVPENQRIFWIIIPTLLCPQPQYIQHISNWTKNWPCWWGISAENFLLCNYLEKYAWYFWTIILKHQTSNYKTLYLCFCWRESSIFMSTRRLIHWCLRLYIRYNILGTNK